MQSTRKHDVASLQLFNVVAVNYPLQSASSLEARKKTCIKLRIVRFTAAPANANCRTSGRKESHGRRQRIHEHSTFWTLNEYYGGWWTDKTLYASWDTILITIFLRVHVSVHQHKDLKVSIFAH